MKRLVQLLFIVAWIAGAVAEGPTLRLFTPHPEKESLRLLVDTEYASLGAKRDQIVLAVDLPQCPRWRVTAPLPTMLAPKQSKQSSSTP